MAERDLILDAGYIPTHDEILAYINEPARQWWRDLNSFFQQNYKSAPKITYSKCSGKPGWNVKHRKSGKSLCTLYPEKDSFIALVVIKLDLVPVIEGLSYEWAPCILDTIKTAKPFNGTLWLMIRVEDRKVFDDVKQLLMLKHDMLR